MNKYRNIRHGVYASRKEADTGAKLRALEKAGVISNLEEQVRFTLIPASHGKRAVVYVADFTFIENGNLVVMDAKGFLTPVYKLKRRLMFHFHGITITEV